MELSFFVHGLHECSRIMGPATAGTVRALAWSADLVSSFASFRDMADVVGKRVRQLPVVDGKSLPLRVRNCFQKTSPCIKG